MARILERAVSRLVVGVLAAIAAVVLVGGLFRLVDSTSAPPIVIDDPAVPDEIVVAVEDAVASPGIVRLPGNARHGDAIGAAGGLTDDADHAAVNPARRLRDEDLLVVPRREPDLPDGVAPRPTATTGGNLGREVPTERTIVPTPADAPTGSPIDINTASVAELDELPGIGPALAERIVALRSERGPFRSVDELELVEGISERTVEQLRPLVTLGE